MDNNASLKRAASPLSGRAGYLVIQKLQKGGVHDPCLPGQGKEGWNLFSTKGDLAGSCVRERMVSEVRRQSKRGTVDLGSSRRGKLEDLRLE